MPKPLWAFEATFPVGTIERHHVKVIIEKDQFKTIYSFRSEEEPLAWKQMMPVIVHYYNLYTDKSDTEGSTIEKGTGLLTQWYPIPTLGGISVVDSCSTKWTVTGLWPKSMDFGELDFTSSDELTIEVTWAYDQFAEQFAVSNDTGSQNNARNDGYTKDSDA